jgi:hypothetical protein
VCRLKKSLYRLKQTPRAWYSRIDRYLQSMGFTKSDLDGHLPSPAQPLTPGPSLTSSTKSNNALPTPLGSSRHPQDSFGDLPFALRDIGVRAIVKPVCTSRAL